ncbi:iron-containing alcohol dehydrogenase [uncultured Sulfitobacter sp.]|uniref:iron-containing alcohol dehydrogenase n=1 Tax=uncultured Sulfitobacter sp. TaxID=191468 RepID=UPI002629EDAC|nr:iron-containing alcohol dehydrogenase [uncultured Sulfitobacter sp.]
MTLTTAPFSINCPTSIQFGAGVSRAVVDVLPAGCMRVAVVRGKSGIAAQQVIKDLEAAGCDVAEVICAQEPTVAAINVAVAALRNQNTHAVVACGGGAVMDAGKAIAFCLGNNLRLTNDFAEVPADLLSEPSRIPCIAIPTTAGTGAEVTSNAVLEVEALNVKLSLRGKSLFPAHAFVDPDLMMSAPAHVVLGSGLDAVVQTVEAYTSCAATRFSDALTGANLTLGLRALKGVVEAPDAAHWADMAWVSMSSGLALANSGLGAAHGVASVFGAKFNAPHGAVCGALLVPVLRQNMSRAEVGSSPERRLRACFAAIAEVFQPINGQDALSGFEQWTRQHQLPSLGFYGMTPDQIDDLAARSCGASSSKKNAVLLTAADFSAILEAAL